MEGAGGFGRAACGGGRLGAAARGAGGAVITFTVWQVGHFPFLPIAPSGTCNLDWQFGQVNSKGMDGFATQETAETVLHIALTSPISSLLAESLASPNRGIFDSFPLN